VAPASARRVGALTARRVIAWGPAAGGWCWCGRVAHWARGNPPEAVVAPLQWRYCDRHGRLWWHRARATGWVVRGTVPAAWEEG
jgi:hypothetical protein